MKIIALNKRAYHNYEILETLDAGIVLKGDEIKSLRAKNISLNDAFATLHHGSMVLTNCYIAPYKHAYSKEDTSRRPRTLLLHKREINRLVGAIARKGLTIVPLKVYLNDRGYAKLELGVAKHKKAANKKLELKERDIKRETARDAKIRLR
jgi:SsrA-binding protein